MGSGKCVVSNIMAVLLLASMLSITLLSFPPKVMAEVWIPYTPDADQVDLYYQKENGSSYIDVVITFPNTGYNVSNWGTPTRIEYDIWVYPEIWKWLGGHLDIITVKSHTYDLGNPPVGEYIFNFGSIKSINFTISPLLGDVNEDGIVDALDLNIVSLVYGYYQGEFHYLPEADINEDGFIDILDVATVARNLGEIVPPAS